MKGRGIPLSFRFPEIVPQSCALGTQFILPFFQHCFCYRHFQITIALCKYFLNIFFNGRGAQKVVEA